MRSIKYFLALWLLISLAHCATTEPKPTQEKSSVPIENIVEVLKNIQLPKP